MAGASATPKLLREIATHLACFSDIELTACQSRLLDHGDPYPPHAYREAAEPVVQRLFALLDEAVRDGSDLLLSHTLSALAWTGSARAVDAMQRWRAALPDWRDMLHWAPHQYAMVAGCEIDAGGIRKLVLDVALQLSPTKAGEDHPPVALFEPDPSGKTCPRCGRAATCLLRVDSAPEVFMRRGLRAIPTCLDCAMFDTIFVRFLDATSWSWLLTGPVATSAPAEHPLTLPPATASLTPRRAWEAADWCVVEGISQLGGHPSWINDPTFPPCPICSRLTMTVAQVAPEDFMGPAEGVFYVHSCQSCAVVGVSYDQT